MTRHIDPPFGQPIQIGIGGQTQASVFKVAPRFPKVKFAIIGGNADPKKPENVSGYDVRQAEIAFVAGASAAMLSKTGGVSYVGGLEIPAIKNAFPEIAVMSCHDEWLLPTMFDVDGLLVGYGNMAPELLLEYLAAGKAQIKANYSPSRAPTYSARLQIKPWTTYSTSQLFGCKGP